MPADARRRLRETSEAILDGVERALPGWVESRIEWIADAWGRLAPSERAALDAAARAAARDATRRVVAELRALFALDAAAQHATPLQIVRTATAEVTMVLAEAGIPPVERDPFAERVFPDDRYGVTPASLANLGDPGLGPLQLAWGLAKADVMRS